MRVNGKIMNQEVVSFIDSKSTHNFLDSTKLPALQLQLDTSKILEVKVANGSIIKTLGVYHGFVILIQGNRIVVDFNVLHWGGGGVLCSGSWYTMVLARTSSITVYPLRC